MCDAVGVVMTPQEALASLRPEMIDVSEARNWVLQRMSPGGGTCPDCDTTIDAEQVDSWRYDKRIRCRHCGRFFTNRSSTLLDGCALGWRDVYLVLVLIAYGCTDEEIASRVNVHPRTIKRMQRRILVSP